MSRLAPNLSTCWNKLNEKIISCRKCPRLVEYRQQIARNKRRQYRDWEYWGKPVAGFGDREAQLLLVGLAPAAHGANRTGRMFTGDSSGDWLYEALYRYGFASQPTSCSSRDGLQLKNVYITAAARCAPPKNKPLVEELQSCRPFLLAEYRLLTRVRVVLTLGRIAFASYLACRREAGHPPLKKQAKFSHGEITLLPEGAYLITSYHPSRQNTQTGRLTRPMWYAVFEKAKQSLGALALGRSDA